jgi:hypothetical protein
MVEPATCHKHDLPQALSAGRFRPAAYMELLFRSPATPIEIIPGCADLPAAMIEHQLTNPDWNLIRLAIVIIDVAAVALVVVLWGFAKAWWRRAAKATARGRSGRPARYAAAASLGRPIPSGATHAHRALR